MQRSTIYVIFTFIHHFHEVTIKLLFILKQKRFAYTMCNTYYTSFLTVLRLKKNSTSVITEISQTEVGKTKEMVRAVCISWLVGENDQREVSLGAVR